MATALALIWRRMLREEAEEEEDEGEPVLRQKRSPFHRLPPSPPLLPILAQFRTTSKKKQKTHKQGCEIKKSEQQKSIFLEKQASFFNLCMYPMAREDRRTEKRAEPKSSFLLFSGGTSQPLRGECSLLLFLFRG